MGALYILMIGIIISVSIVVLISKIKGNGNTENEFEFSGDIVGKSIVKIDNDKIIIQRKGVLSTMSKGLAGSKTIRISQISGTQYKKAGIAVGYLQFILKGSQEVKGGIQAARNDENTVVWGYKSQNAGAEKIIDYINKYNEKNDNSKREDNSNDKYSEIKQLKELLDMGAITQEEFNKKKKELLK